MQIYKKITDFLNKRVKTSVKNESEEKTKENTSSIATAIAAENIFSDKVALTAKWFKNKVKKIFNKKKNVEKVAAATLEKLFEECPNDVSWEELLDEGYTHVIASVDYNGKIDDVELIKDISGGDYELENMFGEERMIVVTR
ncbi:MAG: hypothetical protein NC320_13340 [Clostridium sp.]|nr:hypothetical protein [Clostridium sp.]